MKKTAKDYEDEIAKLDAKRKELVRKKREKIMREQAARDAAIIELAKQIRINSSEQTMYQFLNEQLDRKKAAENAGENE